MYWNLQPATGPTVVMKFEREQRKVIPQFSQGVKV